MNNSENNGVVKADVNITNIAGIKIQKNKRNIKDRFIDWFLNNFFH